MSWLTELARTPGVAGTTLVLSLVIATGLGLGSLKVGGFRLGVAGVLFTGLAFAHAGFALDLASLHFLREFGLILFVFTIGLQIGPGFVPSLRRHGLLLNSLAVATVALGAAATWAVATLAHLPHDLATGLFCGATTNTPALGAAQEALGGQTARAAAAAAGYAVAYPMGVIGILLSMLVLRAVFRIDVPREVERVEAERRAAAGTVARVTLRVANPQLDGLPLREVPGLAELHTVISRIQPGGDGDVRLVRADTVLHVGDLVVAVGDAEALARFARIIGPVVERDLRSEPGRVTTRRIVVTRKAVLGQSIAALRLDDRFGVTVTRLTRTGLEMTARADLELQFGDVLQVVGEENGILQAAAQLGNSTRELNVTRFGGIFLGIALGVVLGSLPLRGEPVPLRLGLAGGPLVVAIVLSGLGRLGPLVFYMPANANLAVRELGITLFLACVGLASGPGFFASMVSPTGAAAFAAGATITLVPLLVVGALVRAVWRVDYTTLCGLLAGSMTDPPALAFAGNMTRSDAPAVAYATVYPLTMLLRVIAAQALVYAWWR